MSIPNKVNNRISFAAIKNQLEYPDFLEVQLKSFHEFFQLETTPENRKREGLYQVFHDNFPISDTRNNFVLEFIDYTIDPPRYSIDECVERGLTFSVPLKAKLKLYCTDPEHEDFDTVIQDVYLGTVPYMTERGVFIINGAERVVVSQLHRSPGVFFDHDKGKTHSSGKLLYSARVIPYRGSWLDFEFDPKDCVFVRIDRRRKFPATVLLKALGYSAQEILDYFPNDVKYAAAALYLIGECHFDNGDVEKAMRRWAELAETLPPGVEIVPVYDRGPLIERAVTNLRQKLVQQCLIVALPPPGDHADERIGLVPARQQLDAKRWQQFADFAVQYGLVEKKVDVTDNKALKSIQGARILLAEHPDVLLVQRGQFLDSGAGRVAYVVGEDRVALRRQIETGARSLGAVEVLSGLEPGDTIVISNLDPFRGADTVLLTN